ncbi:MAG: LysM peptidoglycan-binding domain-containing protein [Phycisphaerales bacterium JB065]
MTREHKLALILGFALVLVVGVLVSDHISGSQRSVATAQSMDDPVRAIESEYGPGLGLVSHTSRDRTLPGLDDPQEAEPIVVADSVANGLGGVVDKIHNGLDRLTQDPPPSASQVDRSGQDREQEVASGPGSFIMDPEINARSRVGGGREDNATQRMHRVAKGETLWSIAERYYGDGKVSFRLAEWNEDKVGARGTIRPGILLAIPSRAELDGVVASGTAPASSQDLARKEPDRQPQVPARVYVVKKNDVLSTIAQRELGTVKRMDEILRLNRDKIDSPDEIWVGLELKLPAT